jgi:hypothetical protein
MYCVLLNSSLAASELSTSRPAQFRIGKGGRYRLKIRQTGFHSWSAFRGEGKNSGTA